MQAFYASTVSSLVFSEVSRCCIGGSGKRIPMERTSIATSWGMEEVHVLPTPIRRSGNDVHVWSLLQSRVSHDGYEERKRHWPWTRASASSTLVLVGWNPDGCGWVVAKRQQWGKEKETWNYTTSIWVAPCSRLQTSALGWVFHHLATDVCDGCLSLALENSISKSDDWAEAAGLARGIDNYAIRYVVICMGIWPLVRLSGGWFISPLTKWWWLRWEVAWRESRRRHRKEESGWVMRW